MFSDLAVNALYLVLLRVHFGSTRCDYVEYSDKCALVGSKRWVNPPEVELVHLWVVAGSVLSP